MRGGACVSCCWQFLCFNFAGVRVSGGIICTLISYWLGGCVIMLSRLGISAFMGGTFGVTMIGGIVSLGNDGATLGDDTGSRFDEFVGTCCCGWTVAR